MKKKTPIATYLTIEQISALKTIIFKKRLSLRKLAPILNMSISTISLKLNGRVEFTQMQIFNICTVMDIPLESIHNYFFDTSLHHVTDKV